MDFLEIIIDRAMDLDRDDVEDAVTEAFAGIGATTGAGTGEDSSSLDLELDEDRPDDEVLERVFQVIEGLGVGDAIYLSWGGDRTWRLSEWRSR